MSYWMIDLRKTAVKKWAKYASDVTLVLFSKNKKKLKQARQLPSAEVCDVSGKKYGKTMLKHIKAYVRNHPEATLWVFTRNKKLRKRCQKWQARHPEVQLWVLKKLPSELPVEAETVEVEVSAVEANEVVVETAVAAEAQVDNEMPTVEVEAPVVEANDGVVETTVAAEAQVDNETPTAEAETPVVETNEVVAETAVVAEAQADNEAPTAEAETAVLEANEVVVEMAVAEEAQADNETPTVEVETPVLEANEVEAETVVAAEVQADNETPTAEAETPVVEANDVEAETAVVEEAQADNETPAAEAETAVVAETPTPEHEETLVFTMETEVFAETAPVNSAVLEAQAVIKKNKPKKKQQLIHLLAQTLRLETAVAQDLVQQLQAAGNITIDAAENIKYCS